MLCFITIPVFATGQVLDDARNQSDQFMAYGLREGRLVIKNNDGIFELIDGQQRLTTLYLIMKYLTLYMDLKYS